MFDPKHSLFDNVEDLEREEEEESFEDEDNYEEDDYYEDEDDYPYEDEEEDDEDLSASSFGDDLDAFDSDF